MDINSEKLVREELIKVVRSIEVYFFFQAEDGIRDRDVMEFRRVLFRSSLIYIVLSTRGC